MLRVCKKRVKTGTHCRHRPKDDLGLAEADKEIAARILYDLIQMIEYEKLEALIARPR